MNILLRALAKILKRGKYKNTTQIQQENVSKPQYTFEEDQYGYKHFKKDGVTHNIVGPAIIYRSGTCKYYINGIEFSPEMHKIYRRRYLRYLNRK
jgi:hypothetical protein